MKIRIANKDDLAQLDTCMQELLQFESQYDENLDCNTAIKGNYAPLEDATFDEIRSFSLLISEAQEESGTK